MCGNLHAVVCITRSQSMTVPPPYGHTLVAMISAMNSLLATVDTGYDIVTWQFGRW